MVIIFSEILISVLAAISRACPRPASGKESREIHLILFWKTPREPALAVIQILSAILLDIAG
jgi:hypothetical protein